MFHLALAAPLLVGRSIAQLTRARRDGCFAAAALYLSLASALVLWIGAFTYLDNLLRFHNPIYPIHTRLPFFGEVLGPTDPLREWTMPFFLTPGSLEKTVRSWYAPFPQLWPDVRSGGFGPLFAYLTFPALALCVPLLAGRRARAGAATALGLFALAVVVPDAAWPRFALAAPAAGIAAFSLLHASLHRTAFRRALSAAALALGLCGLWLGLPPMGPTLDDLRRAARLSHAERGEMQLSRWLWPPAAVRLRETELRSGDAIAYDGSAQFYSELWTRDLRNRAVFVRHPQDAGASGAEPSDPGLDADFLSALSREGAVWAAQRSSSYGARVLRRIGAQPLFTLPVSDCVMYRLPGR
jgi:hypothetical protein